MPRKVFVAGEILTAADVNTNLMDQAVMVFDDSTARGSAIPSPSEGMVTYLKDADELQVYTTDWGRVGRGQILQIVRATDSTDRTTTSTSFTDVTGMSVTISPTESDSALIIQAVFQLSGQLASFTNTQITDSSDVVISGAESSSFNSINTLVTQIGYVAPATTSAVTYKLRFKRSGGSATTISNSIATGQMYAIEVSA